MVISINVPSGSVQLFSPDNNLPKGLVRTTFYDGYESNFSANEETIMFSNQFGYGNDDVLYSMHHDLTHHFVARELGWMASGVIWADAHGDRYPEQWDYVFPRRREDEEHIVNQLLAMMRLNKPDTYKVIDGLWQNVPSVIERLKEWLEPISSWGV